MTDIALAIADATIEERLSSLDWQGVASDLWARGFASTSPVLTPEECEQLIALFDDDARFRSRVDMARHRFGEGEYKYFASPLPPVVQALRTGLYPPLAEVANEWMRALGASDEYSPTLDEFLARCAEAGQTKPTPLLLHYEAGGYNCLHQDIYGDVAFPMQVVVLLNRPGVDFDGGEFLLVEQRPRAQSVGEAVRLEQGSLLVFTTRARPVRGSKGFYRGNMRHGVSRVRRGRRYTLGVIFHDAR